MLDEYAITPDTFEADCYSAANLCPIYLQVLKEPLLQEAVVSDLRAGKWSQYLNDKAQASGFDPRAKELLKKLKNRLRPVAACLPTIPTDSKGWCEEAIQADAANPINGIIVSHALAAQYPAHARVCSVEGIFGAAWWRSSGQSQETHRTTAEYLRLLHRLFQTARSFMFIDPHLDPHERRYAEFLQLLLACKRSSGPQPRIEVHRVCTIGSGRDAQVLDRPAWEARFRSAWQDPLQAAGLGVDVFIWDDFHDRFLITDLMGLHVGNGFDVSRNPQETVTWSRLSRRTRDDKQREFDEATNRHHLNGRKFHLGV